MKPDNWIDGLIWKDKDGKLWKVNYLTSGPYLDYPFQRIPIDNEEVAWRDKVLIDMEVTNLTEEEAYLIEKL